MRHRRWYHKIGYPSKPWHAVLATLYVIMAIWHAGEVME